MFEALYEIIKDHKITHRTRFHKETYVNDVKDTFVHMDMGTLRSLAKKYGDSVTDNQWKKLMTHEYHEFRMLALLILMQDINCHQHLKKVYHHYITYIDFVNNWDLVDVSAPNIVGRYVFETNNIHILNQFAC